MSAPTEHPSDAATTARNMLVIRILTVAAFIVILNETIMTVAIPQLMTAFSVDARAAQWLSTGFMLTMAVVIPATGWFLQRFGIRTSFTTAMTLFSLGTLLSALAPTFPILVAGRVIQASGTAVMMPLLMSTVLTLIPEAQRGRVMGNVSLAMSVAPALGPTISGLILQFAQWRWLFGFVLPIAVVIGLVGTKLLAGGTDEARPGRLDALSLVLTAVGFGGLVYGLSGLGGEGGDSNTAAVALVVGIVFVTAFVLRQRSLQRTGDPLLDLRVLTDHGYRTSLVIMSVLFMALMGVMILLPMFLQRGRGMDALHAGLLLAPGGLAMGLLGPTVGRLYDKLGVRRLVIPGAAVVVTALVLLALAAPHAHWGVVLVLHVVMSIALACTFTPIFTYGLSGLPPHLYSHGSAMLGTIQQVAAAAGTALSVTIMATRQGSLAASGVDAREALAGGAQAGIALGAVLAAVALGCAFLLRDRSTAPASHVEAVAEPASATDAGHAAH